MVNGRCGPRCWLAVAATDAWLTFRAERLDSADASIAVTITASSPTERRQIYVRAHGLTLREIEIVDLLAAGGDTRSTAAALHLSEFTVQDHLKAIFAKTGTRNRRTLLNRIVGR